MKKLLIILSLILIYSSTGVCLSYDEMSLHSYAYSGRFKEVKSLLAKGTAVNSKDEAGRTPLLVATERGHFPVVKYLIGKGAKINAKDNNGRTVLHEAARSSSNLLPMVKYLIGKGAKINAKDNSGWTAYDYANFGSNKRVANFLRGLMEEEEEEDVQSKESDYTDNTLR